MDALEAEEAPTGCGAGCPHYTKAEQTLVRLRRILRKEDIAPGTAPVDFRIATTLIQRLENAIAAADRYAK